MKNRTITAPEGAQYITAEMMKDLPEKYVLSKGITGCGATT